MARVSSPRIVRALDSACFGAVGVHFGDVEVSYQITGYQRRRISTAEIIDTTPLELPRQELQTRAVWYTVDAEAIDEAVRPVGHRRCLDRPAS